jgi:cysteine desulfurase
LPARSFTSCGTESDNWAIAAAVADAAAQSPPGAAPPHVVTSAIEHPAVLQYLSAQAAAGALSYTAVPPAPDGGVRADDLAAAITDRTCLLTLMHSNNETGALQPVREAAAAAAARGVRTHTDAAQSCGKVSVDVRALGVDYATVVGHKFGAPKGVAALYARRGAPLARLLQGGGQERGMRPGTESVLLVVGLGAAAALAREELPAAQAHCAALRDALQEALQRELGGADGSGVRVHAAAAPCGRLPNTLSIAVRGLRASTLLDELRDVVAASAGAACHAPEDGAAAAPAGAAAAPPPRISGVLRAMGVPDDYAVGTLRLSVGRHTTRRDVERAAQAVVAAARRQLAAAR